MIKKITYWYAFHTFNTRFQITSLFSQLTFVTSSEFFWQSLFYHARRIVVWFQKLSLTPQNGQFLYASFLFFVTCALVLALLDFENIMCLLGHHFFLRSLNVNKVMFILYYKPLVSNFMFNASSQMCKWLVCIFSLSFFPLIILILTLSTKTGAS